MSMLDSMDDALLGADDDEELDYDLEKDEEDALLADPDNYDEENYDGVPDDTYAAQTLNEEGSEVLEIDVNIALDDTEEDIGDHNESKDKKDQDEPSDQEQEEEQQKERGRFTSERNHVIHRNLSSEIPDSLDKINVHQFNNTQRNGNNKFQRINNTNNNQNKNRFKNRPQNNRGSVFGRVGILPSPGHPPLGLQEDKNNLGKTVLINPHFRGNVQVNENARLVWDAAQGGYPAQQNQQRYPNPQMAQVAPFQSQFPQQNQQPAPWIHPPYNDQSTNVQAAPPHQDTHFNNHQHFNQSQMTGWGEEPSYPCDLYSQGNFNNRDGRFNNNNSNTTMPPPLMSHPPPHFNQPPPPPLFHNRPQYHETPVRRQYPSHQNNAPNNNNFDSNFQQNYPQSMPNHANQQQLNNQPFNQQPPPYIQQQYDPGNAPQFPNPNPNYSDQYGGAVPFQQAQSHPNFQPPNQSNFDNFTNRPNPELFQPQLQVQFNNNRAFNNNNQAVNNRMKNQQQAQRINRTPFNYNQRTPPKRRPFENNLNKVEVRDLPKKKKRSLELSNLHEVPTVDMPDTTTMEDKPESEDEETKAYRQKIEEQKILREKILREKEERRKLAAAQKEAEDKLAATDSLITTLKTKPAVIQQQFKIQSTNTPQPITTRINSQTPKNIYTQIRNNNKTKQEPRFNQNITVNNQEQQQTQVWINQNQSPLPPKQARILGNQNQQTRVIQTTSTRIIQQPQQQPRRLMQQKQQANIIITQKVTPETQPQRIVMFKQPPTQQQQQQLQPQPQSNRRVVLKSNGATIDGSLLPETPVVVVSNLAAATTEPKIRKLCQGLGPIQNVEMIPNSRQAMIRFKNVQSAHKFFKKYQRKIIDLSMIQVVLGQPVI